MDDLKHYQSRFSDYLLNPGSAADANLLGNFRGNTEAGLQVYRNNVIHSLSEALSAHYPAIQSLVGERFFAALARDYVVSYPPTSPVLTFYGEHLADFINGHKACQNLQFLPDVARLESLCQRALHAADDPVVNPDQLATLSQAQLQNLRLTLHSSVQLLQSAWPIDEIQEQSLSDNPVTVPLAGNTQRYILVYRPGLHVQIVCLQESAWRFLQALQENMSLAQAWQDIQARKLVNEEELIPLLLYLFSLNIYSAYHTTPEA